MSIAQSAMKLVIDQPQVVELALIVKDNLPCKHLVLSVEEALVNFLQDDSTSPDGFLELEPMDPYKRRLLHCLADIFGFAHVSVGEGDNRHLVLERCGETSIPSILVSDILFLYDDEPQSLTSHQLLKRADVCSVSREKSPSLHTFEEREAAYQAARERIFSRDGSEISEPVKYRPRNVPAVARRMIAHALGQKITPRNQDHAVTDHERNEEQTNSNIQEDKDNNTGFNSSMETLQGTVSPPNKSTKLHGKAKNNNKKRGATLHGRKLTSQQEPAQKTSTDTGYSQNVTGRDGIKKEYSKDEHLGAAKRMFAHALGLQSGKGDFLTRCSQTKQHGTE